MKSTKLHLTTLLALCFLLLCGCGKSRRGSSVYLSPKAQAAKRFIDNELPADQRRAFYTGDGDKYNLYANLMDSGHLDGATEYAEALQKASEGK